MILLLPYPPSSLNPNSRLHPMALHRAKKAYKQTVMWEAKAQGASKVPAEALVVNVCFAAPDKRARDLDNVIAAFKAGQDGLAEVLGVDDSKWTVSHGFAFPKKPGRVVVEIGPKEIPAESR